MPQAPIQPMAPNTAQSNLRGMIDEISSWNPDFPPWMSVQSVNTWLRRVIDQRMWSGLLVKDQLVIPAQTSTGTVDVTLNSPVITGTGTGWPYNDVLSTTLNAGPSDLNILVNVTPASMGTGSSLIISGDWVTIDGGTGNEEQVLVVSTTATTFKGVFTISHSPGVTCWKSSLMRQQFIYNNLVPRYTIKGVSSATRLVLSENFGLTTTTGASYSISKVYVTFGQQSKFVMAVTNFSMRYRVKLHIPQEQLNQSDPQRTATESTYILADFVPDEVGRLQYELYPRPTSPQAFGCLYYRQISNLSDDDDTPPPFISTDVLVKASIADALRWRPKQNKYYSESMALSVAGQKLQEFNQGVKDMMTSDDSGYMQNLLWTFGNFPWGGMGANWYQNHDVGIMMGEV